MLPLWPHQERGVRQCVSGIESGWRNFCLTSPTGGGKSRMMYELIRYARSRDWSVTLYATRNMLIQQLMKVMDGYGLSYGVRASDFQQYENLDLPIQIASIKTEESRVFERKQRNLHYSKLVLWDEAHMQKAGIAETIYMAHAEQGAINAGITATPLGLSHLYDNLVVAGNNTEMRQCGAHVPCYVYAPNEPDLKGVRRDKTGEYVIGGKKHSIWTQSVVGSVIENYNILNPERKPTLLFAPGVKESIWFVNQLEAAGIRAAHIDGSDVYYNGQDYPTSPDRRDYIVEEWRAGRIDVVCNRFVMREGIDITELYHIILATPIGSLLSYLQAVGRELRNHESLDHVILQDHGGNIWQHGSPNENRDWKRLWKMDEREVSTERAKNKNDSEEKEPIVCPKCTAVRLKGPECITCGFKHTKSVRMVVQKDGTLKRQSDDAQKKRKQQKKTDHEALWTKCYFIAKNSRMSFKQAAWMYKDKAGHWPKKDMPYMPTDEHGWARLVKDVPVTDLIGRK